MIKKSTFRIYNILGQVGIFLVLFMMDLNYGMEFMDFGRALVYGLGCTMLTAIMAYTYYFFILNMYISGRKIQFFIVLILYVSLFVVINDEMEQIIFLDQYEGPFWANFAYYFPYFMMMLGVTSLYYFVEAWFENFQKQSLLQNQKLQAELNFLKSQINPHFLFNTLNNIYSYAQMQHPKTAPMLERLSSILRFMVYDCSEDQVVFNKELRAIDDLLEIVKMKNSEQRNISLEVKGVRGYHLIAPLIIVNFVENACKHSDVISNKNGFIKVEIEVDEDDNCLVNISNSIKKKETNGQNPNGVGLANITKRLELQYQDNYKMEVKEEDRVYHMVLELPLERKK